MSRYVIKRILMMFPVLLCVILLIFVLQALAPGDPAVLNLGVDASQEALEEWRAEYNLDEPILVQYGEYLWGLVTRGDFGRSYRTGQDVTAELLSRWPTTFVLAILTQLVGFTIGLTTGTIAALNRNTWIDSVARVFSMIGNAMPNFWFALLLIMLFALNLEWLPVSGWYGPRYWVLPALSSGVLGAAACMRNTRAAVLDNIKQDYVRTARAKGQKESVVIRHHIMRNAMIPIITGVGLQFSAALGGKMVLEQIFAIPGLGRYMVEAINNRDFPQLRAAVILTCVTVTVINLLIDFCYAAIDPRIKATFKRSSARIKKIKVENNRKEEGPSE